ncbi:MAG: tRNA 2-thiocytidine(32) synthetase TtcA [Oscillospiraceae bacterium]|jgi:tRNA(Ile)-lysidine synthase TilS/MesJ|nr:tRNA 2-thiocytidine(32) synthetase TtcA [Oscillospiraceae bacterium]
MQRILGTVRKAVTDYKMIENGDRIAVGLSGGKDSLALLAGLFRLREFIGLSYGLIAVTVDPRFNGADTDYSAITAMCESLGIDHAIRRSELGEILFVRRQEKNPCSLCARMRRGMLHDMANELGCNKIALGHHRNDAVETLVMNLFYEGRLGCFQPVSYLSRKNLTMIRPLCLATERDITAAVRKEGLPVIEKNCPADGFTARQKTKEWLAAMEKSEFPGLSKKLFGAVLRAHLSGW